MQEKFIIQEDGVRLDRYVKKLFPGLCQSIIEKSLRKKLITLNGQRATSSTRVEKNQELYINKSISADSVNVNKQEVFLDRKSAKLVELLKKAIIYEDENVLAINKPFDLPVQSGSKVKYSIDRLIKSINPNLNVVHRLDKHTTGVLLFAKNSQATTEFWNLFKNRLIKKKYIAVVVGKMQRRTGQVKNFIKKAIISGEEIMQCNDSDGDIAVTHFKVLEEYKSTSLIELSPETGRKHQLRAHMAYLGNPILNDGKYGRKAAFIDGGHKGGAMNLHASSVEFMLLDKNYRIQAKPPKHFQSNL